MTVTGKTLVAGLEVRRQIVGTRLVAMELGDRELTDLTTGAQPVGVAQHVRRTTDEPVVLPHTSTYPHPTVDR